MLKMLQDRSEEPRSVKSYETDVTEFDVWGAAGTMYAAGQDTVSLFIFDPGIFSS